jgi:MFS family permease
MIFPIRSVDRLPSRSPRFYPGWWVVLTCFWLAILGWGVGFYGHGVYPTQLDRIHGGSAVVLSVATTGYYLAGGTLMLFIGTAIDRLGVRNVVLVCTFALCASLALLPIWTRWRSNFRIGHSRAFMQSKAATQKSLWRSSLQPTTAGPR